MIKNMNVYFKKYNMNRNILFVFIIYTMTCASVQKNSSISSAMIFDHIYGLSYDETFHFSNKIEKVDEEEVQKLSEQIFGQKAVISVVGSSSPW